MFCGNCGKELPDNAAVCGYCGSATGKPGMQGNVYQQSSVPQGYNYNSGMPGNGNQQYGGMPGYGNQQYNGGQQGYVQNYGMQQNVQNNQFLPDNRFNICAFFFPFLWSLIKGLYDVALYIFLARLIVGFLWIPPITPIGIVISLIVGLINGILLGRNGNYYYRLKNQQNISTFRAIRNPNLRRL